MAEHGDYYPMTYFVRAVIWCSPLLLAALGGYIYYSKQQEVKAALPTPTPEPTPVIETVHKNECLPEAYHRPLVWSQVKALEGWPFPNKHLESAYIQHSDSSTDAINLQTIEGYVEEGDKVCATWTESINRSIETETPSAEPTPTPISFKRPPKSETVAMRRQYINMKQEKSDQKYQELLNKITLYSMFLAKRRSISPLHKT